MHHCCSSLLVPRQTCSSTDASEMRSTKKLNGPLHTLDSLLDYSTRLAAGEAAEADSGDARLQKPAATVTLPCCHCWPSRCFHCHFYCFPLPAAPRAHRAMAGAPVRRVVVAARLLDSTLCGRAALWCATKPDETKSQWIKCRERMPGSRRKSSEYYVRLYSVCRTVSCAWANMWSLLLVVPLLPTSKWLEPCASRCCCTLYCVPLSGLPANFGAAFGDGQSHQLVCQSYL